MKKTPTNLAIAQRRGKIFRKNIGAWVLLLPSVFCVYFLVLRPQILNVAYSFFDMKGFTVTDFVGIDNYKRVVADPVFLKAFKNTVDICLLVIDCGASASVLYSDCSQ